MHCTMFRSHRFKPLLTVCVFAFCAVAAPQLNADDDTNAKGREFFETKIRPVLVKHCYECHSAKSKDVEGGLLLDTRAGIRKGGESGPAVVPNAVQKSELISAIRYETFEMPPTGKLPKHVINDFVTWIKMGAPDPRDGSAAKTNKPKYQPAAPDELWSLQPIADPEPPKVKHTAWPQSDLDRFILARLEAEGLKPVRDAEPAKLLRRVYFDLIGLPPAPEEVDRFLNDPSPEAYEKTVDRLLASPHFGERWGRHWLDVARYGESNGKSRDVLMPYAWRYRNYVIDAYNDDLPYDQFITEQIAGDLLPADSPQERDRRRIATGFLAIGSKTLVGGTQQMDLIDEQINTMGKAVLGLTTGCARCHDHKFDPIPTRDYYALAGVFLSTKTLFGGGLRGPKDPVGKTKELFVLGPNADDRVQKLRQHKKQVSGLQKQRAKLQKRLKALKKKLPGDWKKRRAKLIAAEKKRAKESEPKGNPPKGNTGEKTKQTLSGKDRQVQEYLDTQDEFRSVQAKLNKLKDRKLPRLEFAVGLRDSKVRDCRLHIRGEQSNRGDEVPRGFLSCIDLKNAPQISKKQSGRLELARWLTHPENPLTPRVAVNRIWLHLFGSGIVSTVDNFGANGAQPTHPKLLDHLARRFRENGWSTKKLIRTIVLSRTYRLSTQFDQTAYDADPGNELYWRMRRRRLEAEAIRDAMLAAGGQLERNRPEASPVARIGDGEVGRGLNKKPLRQPFPHRSVYLPIIRGIVPEFLKTFDFPEPSNVQGQRVTTNVPAQSLFLMNNPFVIKQAEAMADRVLKGESDDEARIASVFKLCYARPPEPQEIEKIRAFLNRAASQSAKDSDGERETWTTVCHALLAAAEFRYIE